MCDRQDCQWARLFADRDNISWSNIEDLCWYLTRGRDRRKMVNSPSWDSVPDNSKTEKLSSDTLWNWIWGRRREKEANLKWMKVGWRKGKYHRRVKKPDFDQQLNGLINHDHDVAASENLSKSIDSSKVKIDQILESTAENLTKNLRFGATFIFLFNRLVTALSKGKTYNFDCTKSFTSIWLDTAASVNPFTNEGEQKCGREILEYSNWLLTEPFRKYCRGQTVVIRFTKFSLSQSQRPQVAMAKTQLYSITWNSMTLTALSQHMQSRYVDGCWL